MLSAGPSTAVANHAAAAPGNQQQFTVDITFTAPAGCAAPQVALVALPIWTNQDQTDITISSAQDVTNGLATCKAKTDGAVTLTATQVSGTSQLVSTVKLTCE